MSKINKSGALYLCILITIYTFPIKKTSFKNKGILECKPQIKKGSFIIFSFQFLICCVGTKVNQTSHCFTKHDSPVKYVFFIRWPL